MTWSNLEAEYEGFPLWLRRPDHPDIWKYKNKFIQLVLVEHHLEKVKRNGLPQPAYNKTLADLDDYLCNLFAGNDKGIIFLVETFGGKRNYYFYTVAAVNMKRPINNAAKKYNAHLEISSSTDKDWNFLKEYPITIFEPRAKRKKK